MPYEPRTLPSPPHRPAAHLFDDVDVEAGLLDLGLQVDSLLAVGGRLCQLVQELQTRHLETGGREGGKGLHGCPVEREGRGYTTVSEHRTGGRKGYTAAPDEREARVRRLSHRVEREGRGYTAVSEDRT